MTTASLENPIIVENPLFFLPFKFRDRERYYFGNAVQILLQGVLLYWQWCSNFKGNFDFYDGLKYGSKYNRKVLSIISRVIIPELHVFLLSYF